MSRANALSPAASVGLNASIIVAVAGEVGERVRVRRHPSGVVDRDYGGRFGGGARLAPPALTAWGFRWSP
jgi:hypothetical protein